MLKFKNMIKREDLKKSVEWDKRKIEEIEKQLGDKE